MTYLRSGVWSLARSFAYKLGGTGTSLTKEEIDNNILCIYGAMKGYGFSDEAIAGMCGCFYEESGMNPAIYETSHGGNLDRPPYFAGGMGLAQWTDYPAYQGKYPNPLWWSAIRETFLWYSGTFQCWLLTKADDASYTSMGYGQGPRWGWQTSSSYPSITFSEYKKFSGSIRDAVTYWFYCLEWHSSGIPEWVNFEARVQWGQYAYDLFHGLTPEVPEGGYPEKPSDPTESEWFLIGILSKKKRRDRSV